jgi:hypothetical protein
MRTLRWAIAAALAVTVVLIGSQSAQSAPVRHVSFTDATQGTLAPTDTVLATATVGHSVTAQVHVDDWSPGPTSVLLLVGRPGSTDDVAQDNLPATAVLLPDNQLAEADHVTGNALTARFTTTVAGRYPVFLFLSGPEGCGTARMDDPAPIRGALTQVGVVAVS